MAAFGPGLSLWARIPLCPVGGRPAGAAGGQGSLEKMVYPFPLVDRLAGQGRIKRFGSISG